MRESTHYKLKLQEDPDDIDIEGIGDNFEKLDETAYSLQEELNEEENARVSADSILDGKITAEKTALDGKIAAEKTARENADNALSESVYTKTEIDNKLSMLEMNIDWKEAVDSFSDISTTYPNPQDGDTVNVKDTDYTYRYNGAEWIAISANSIPKATNAIDGLMSKEDKSKLAGIAAGAQVNSITGVKGSAESGYRTGNVNITAADIGLSNVTNDKQATKAEFNAHTSNTNNPHNVTKSQVGLGNVDNTSDKDKPISTATRIALNEIDSLVYNIDPSNDGTVEMFDALVGKNFIRANEDNTITMKFDDIILGKKYYVIAKNINNIDYSRYYNKLILYSDFLSDNYSYYDCTLSVGFNEEYDFQVNNYRSIIYFSINNSSENDYEDSEGQLVKRMIANIDIVNPIILEDLAAKFDAHKSNTNNPHNVTKSQVGLGNVTNDKQATKSEFDVHTSNANNPHNVTKSQVGLGNVTNDKQATKTEFDALSERVENNEKYKIYYGTCNTVHGNTAKVVDCPDFKELTEGARIGVTFNNGNSAKYMTLNVNSTGAKFAYFPIDGSRKYNNDKIAEIITAGIPYEFICMTVSGAQAWVFCGETRYIHPDTHNAGMITQDSTHRFVTDTEKTTWNNKMNYGSIASDGDFNTVTAAGIYHVSTGTGANRPDEHGGTLFVGGGGSNAFVHQIWIPDSPNQVFKRFKNGTAGWTSWTELLHG